MQTRRTFQTFRFLFIIPISFLLFYSCGQKPDSKNVAKADSAKTGDPLIRGNFSDQKELFIDTTLLTSFFTAHPQLAGYKSDVLQFYTYRKSLYAWYDQNGLVEQASNLYNYLNNSSIEGLRIQIPYKAVLDSLLEDPVITKTRNADLEFLLTAEYLFYADKVWNGISAQTTEKLQWLLPRKKLNLPYLTDSLLKDSSATLLDNRYNFRQYSLLQSQLRLYEKLDSSGVWDSIRLPGKEIKKLDSSESVRAIRHRLYVLGDLSSDTKSAVFDNNLETGIMRFQERNGMAPDGRIGISFMKEINTPLPFLIRKIIVNMERSRWIPTELSSHYLIINIPAFSLYAYDQDTLSFQMNVVVGKDVHKTVIFSGDMKYIVFSPYWNVPSSILKSEVLPAIRRDPNYLKRNNMEWSGNTVRQKPGPKNSLGLVKFLFPNSHNIYLHDSPAKSLFSQSDRAFSHGCIRLAEPKKLAVYMLKGDSGWDEKKIDQAMHSGKEKYVTLKTPVPVYIGYLTAWVDNSGRLNFRKDIYNRDGVIEKMIIQ